MKEKNKELNNVSLIKSIKYLGYFGMIHGISEWVTMIVVVDLYPDLSLALYNINQILKSLSFTYLFLFGFDLLPLRKKVKRRILLIPILLFFLFLTGYLGLMAIHGADYHLLNLQYNIITMRYSLGFPSGIIAAVALFLNGNQIAKSKSLQMAKRYKSLAWVFLINGLLEGLFVSQSNFFPANIINKGLFMEYVKVPSLFLKVLVGIFISYLLYKVVETFDWEQKEKLNRLKKHRISSEVRRRLGLEIHDSIIQGLYAAGLKVEYVMLNKNGEKTNEILEEVKIDLNHTIEKTREFISHSSLQKIEMEDLIESLKQLIHQYNENQRIQIRLNDETSSLHVAQLSPETSTQIYYVIQEAICNVVKHSKASHAEVWIETKQNYLYITITDNGIGMNFNEMKNLDRKTHLGISSMKERSESVGGSFHISNSIKGTSVEVKIPWECLQNEKTENQSNVS
ncbi:sensor histidine kinase [Niallia sp. Krafla_26]|uniref:sensor histidine kinase n=1 Tax=Niallia sp. Krafla_26 TaxID=3064703 RepID=UPI003D1633AF